MYRVYVRTYIGLLVLYSELLGEGKYLRRQILTLLHNKNLTLLLNR